MKKRITNVKPGDMLLYAVTDSSSLNGRTLSQAAEEALEAGVTFLQFREKRLEGTRFIEEAANILKIAQKYKVPCVMNDDVETAKLLNADGVHIGQRDMALFEARKILGPDKIIGVSARTVAQAVEAEQGGADYLGVGAVFDTATKQDAKAVTRETVQEICEAVSIPVVVIGGINENNISELKGYQMDGIAVVSAIFASKNIPQSVKKLKMMSERIIHYRQI